MKAKTRRLLWIIAGLTSLTAAVFILMNTMRDSMVFYYSPSELAAKNLRADQVVRLGGLVKKNSVAHPTPTITTFVVTDYDKELEVEYQGLLPDLFREGQGVVATGSLKSPGHFVASQLLAKHDEKYMPKGIAKSLKVPHK